MNRMTMPPAEVAVACFRRATPAPWRDGSVLRRGRSSSRRSSRAGRGRPLDDGSRRGHHERAPRGAQRGQRPDVAAGAARSGGWARR